MTFDRHAKPLDRYWANVALSVAGSADEIIEAIVITKCAVNLELLKNVVAKLTEIEALTNAQRQAIEDDDDAGVEDLHQKLQLLFRAKEHAVEAWLRHHREHQC